MTTGPSFEAYLVSKKIDSEAFRKSEPEVWSAWKKEFEQVHANSFTMQKLNLINPVRRKYTLPTLQETRPAETVKPVTTTEAQTKPVRPVMKPKTNPDS
jgi:hypothetical protein